MDRKRVAICYYGLSYNLDNVQNSNADSAEINYEWLIDNHKNSLWMQNNADIFIHTWKSSKEEEIKNLYSPKLSLFEPQIDFSEHANSICSDSSLEYYSRRNHLMSRWYSNKKVLELKNKYETLNNFSYDIVMVTRFDSIFRGDWNISNLNNDMFYVTGGWPCDYSKYLPDVWFISNSNNMNILGKLFDEIKYTYYDNSDGLNNDWNSHSLVLRHLTRYNINNKINHFKNHYTDSNIARFDSSYSSLKNKK
jgi:hypothetical protein